LGLTETVEADGGCVSVYAVDALAVDVCWHFCGCDVVRDSFGIVVI
jgi:hypothetical protein